MNSMEISSRAFVVYLLTAASVAILSAFLLPRTQYGSTDHSFKLGTLSATVKVWPELDVSWRSALATVIGFVGSAFGTVGGVGGGGIFVPMLNLIVGFDTKSAAALSKCMIMGASMSSVWYNIRVAHPSKDVPIIDYDLALIFQPMLMLGITIGVALSVVFPYWLITVLIIVLFLGTSSRSFFRGILMWKHESLLLESKQRHAELFRSSSGKVIIGPELEPLLSLREKSGPEILRLNLRWKRILVLMFVWCSFLLLQIIKNNAAVCSPLYWILNALQIPVAISVFWWEAQKLYRESKERRTHGNCECVCEASIEWSLLQLFFCALCGILGGTVGGLLGSGGGFILGPLLLEIGVIPQVASATATFVMMFSSSISVVEFYLLGRFPIPYALYLMAVSVLAGFWGQCLVRKMVVVLKRASIIVFSLSAVIFASAITMGVVGIEQSISMIRHHEYMGFLNFCEQ